MFHLHIFISSRPLTSLLSRSSALQVKKAEENFGNECDFNVSMLSYVDAGALIN